MRDMSKSFEKVLRC